METEVRELRSMLSQANRRLEALERELERGRRTDVATTALVEPRPAPLPARAPVPPRVPRRERRPQPAPRRHRSLEEWLSPRVLALIGGGVTFIGVAFLVALGVNNGWIGPEARVIAAGVLSLGLGAAGCRFRARGEPGLGTILVGTAIAGAYATLLGATALYGFLPDPVGLVGALLVAAAGSIVGLRWKDQAVVALALGGALAAPLLIEAPSEAITVAYLVAALGGGAAVAAVQRWWGLAAGLVALALPQVAVGAFEHPGSGLPGLALIWIEVAAATLVPVLAADERNWRPALWLFGLASSATAVVGYAALAGEHPADVVWVFSFAVSYLLVAFGARHLRADLEQLFDFALLAGFGMAALGAALVLDGPALVVAWSVEAALLTIRPSAERERPGYWPLLGSAVLYLLAVGRTLLDEAPPAAIVAGPADGLGAAFALAALAAAALAAARFLPEHWREAPMLAALGVVAYAIPVFTSGEASVALWAATGALACFAARPLAARGLPIGGWALIGLALGYAVPEVAPPDGSAQAWPVIVAMASLAAAAAAIAVVRPGAERTAGIGLAFLALAYAVLMLLSGPLATLALAALALAAAYLRSVAAWRRAVLTASLVGIALIQSLITVAPPGGLASGTGDLLAAMACLGIVAAAALVGALPFAKLGVTLAGRRFGLLSFGRWVSGTVLVYAGSLAVVELVGGEGGSLGLEGIEQPAQAALSAYWAAIGVGAVIAGLRLGRRPLRTAGLLLLGLALAKIFVLDLSSLEASYRALSFMAVGLLLLAASFAYRRLARDDAEPDELDELEFSDERDGWLAPLLAVLVALMTGLAIAAAGALPSYSRLGAETTAQSRV